MNNPVVRDTREKTYTLSEIINELKRLQVEHGELRSPYWPDVENFSTTNQQIVEFSKA